MAQTLTTKYVILPHGSEEENPRVRKSGRTENNIQPNKNSHRRFFFFKISESMSIGRVLTEKTKCQSGNGNAASHSVGEKTDRKIKIYVWKNGSDRMENTLFYLMDKRSSYGNLFIQRSRITNGSNGNILICTFSKRWDSTVPHQEPSVRRRKNVFIGLTLRPGPEAPLPSIVWTYRRAWPSFPVRHQWLRTQRDRWRTSAMFVTSTRFTKVLRGLIIPKQLR